MWTTNIKRNEEVIKEHLLPLLLPGACIAGGYARECLSPNSNTPRAEDIDIFPGTDYNFGVIMGILRHHQGDVIRTDKAITYKNYLGGMDLQVIKPEGKLANVSPKTLVSDFFDFTVNKAYIDHEGVAFIGDKFDEDEAAMTIHFEFGANGCPFNAFRRLIKYTSKGYKVPPSEILKLFEMWEALTVAEKNQIKEDQGLLLTPIGCGSGGRYI